MCKNLIREDQYERNWGGCWRRLRAIRLRYKSEPCWKDRERSGRNPRLPGSQRKIQRGLHHFLEPKSGAGGFLHLPHNRSVLLFLMALVSSLEMACGSEALCPFSAEFQNTAPQAFDQIMFLVVQYHLG